MTDLNRLRISGTPHEFGQALGQWGRDAVHRLLRPCALWQSVTHPRHAGAVAAMADLTQSHFPAIHAEIAGLAEGLGLPLPEVMAWNFRGDLLASVPDGCTSLLYPATKMEGPRLAHNEDGLPFLRGHCALVEAAPAGAPGFIAFCYPGSIPGHTFAATSAGLAQVVNNMRLTGVAVGQRGGLPRMVLGRAVLAAPDLAGALAILRAHPAAGGFHFGLADRTGICSVEFGGGALSERPITAPAAHANHALHLNVPQHITASSRDRQTRAGDLLDKAEPLAILLDRGGPGLPIHRAEADDPDDENTLATALLHVTPDGIDWAVHDAGKGGQSSGPVHSGRIARL